MTFSAKNESRHSGRGNEDTVVAVDICRGLEDGEHGGHGDLKRKW